MFALVRVHRPVGALAGSAAVRYQVALRTGLGFGLVREAVGAPTADAIEVQDSSHCAELEEGINAAKPREGKPTKHQEVKKREAAENIYCICVRLCLGIDWLCYERRKKNCHERK